MKPNLLKLKADYQLLDYVIVALYRILWRTKGGQSLKGTMTLCAKITTKFKLINKLKKEDCLHFRVSLVLLNNDLELPVFLENHICFTQSYKILFGVFKIVILLFKMRCKRLRMFNKKLVSPSLTILNLSIISVCRSIVK